LGWRIEIGQANPYSYTFDELEQEFAAMLNATSSIYWADVPSYSETERERIMDNHAEV
jgi:hypothetical protein